jgi:hypothetical protein
MLPKLQLMVIRKPSIKGRSEKHGHRVVRQKVVSNRTMEKALN